MHDNPVRSRQPARTSRSHCALALSNSAARYSQIDDERMPYFLQNVLLVLYVFNLLQSNDVTDSQDLHRSVLLGRLLAAKAHLAKSSCSYNNKYTSLIETMFKRGYIKYI